MKTLSRCLLICAGLTAAPFAYAQSPEAPLIAVMKSDATQQQKAEACIDLAKLGTQASIAPLAALLGDATLAHMARYGLEPIPDPAVDEALRAALGQLKGKLLAGVIQSIGVRRDAAAVEPLTALLGDTDPDVASAAAAALGKIGTPTAVAALKQSLAKVPAAAEGLLRCAEAAAAPAQAIALYDVLRTAPVPPLVKVAATRGAILARGTAGVPLLLEQLRSDDAVLFSLALRVGIELPGTEVTQALSAEAGKLPADKQGRLIALLAERGDASAIPTLLDRARSGTPDVRVAAIRALARLGHASAVPVLAELAGSDDAEVAKAALAALAGFSGPDVNATIIALLNKPDVKLRLMGVDLIGRRRITEAVPELMRLAGDPDPQLCGPSLKVLGDLAGVKDLPALLGILQKTALTEEAADALSAVCSRQATFAPGSLVIRKAVYGALPDGPAKDVSAKVSEIVKSGQSIIDVSNTTFGDAAPGKVKKFQVDYVVNGVMRRATANENASVRLDLGTQATVSPEIVEPLLAAYAQAQGAPKRALLRILCSAGGDQALAVVRAATGDADAELKEAALRALCDWPSPEALPDLEKLVQAAPTPKLKILALRGYIRLVEVQTAPAAAKAAALKQAFGWAARDEERRLALASLGAAPCPEALAFAAESLGNAALKDDACQGAVDIAEALALVSPELVSDVLRKVVKAGAKDATLKRARKLLGQLKKASELAASEEGFTPMFNGKDLTGWEAKGGSWWRAVDGVLTGESTTNTPLASNNHLIWKGGTPGDFELRAEFRLSKSANSGVQLRCEAAADRDSGYQADMNGGGNFVGFLYHPKMHLIGGRGETVTLAADGKKESHRFADSDGLQKLYKVEDWNTYRIVCRGPEITLYVNGVLMTQVVDNRPDTPRQGAITLQLHKGPPMKVEFRNVRIKALK